MFLVMFLFIRVIFKHNLSHSYHIEEQTTTLFLKNVLFCHQLCGVSMTEDVHPICHATGFCK